MSGEPQTFRDALGSPPESERPARSVRQTQSYLRSLFVQRGISPQHRLGQNFLIDLNMLDLVVKESEAGPGDVILEIGSGTGALTSLLAERGALVVAVDVDPSMARLTAEAVAGSPNVRVLNIDALANKNTLNPELQNCVRAALAGGTGKCFKIVANLPYHVATPVIANLLVHSDMCPALMVVTVQRELAERICAAPASASYGAVSVVVQALADVSILRLLPPAVFWPRPKVDSAVVAIRPSSGKRAAVGDVAWFHEFVRRVFLHRRKYLRYVLADTWRDRWSRADVDAWLESQGKNGQVRAEALEIGSFVKLAHALRQRWGELPRATGRRTKGDQRAHRRANQCPE
jgi:16S rRNA (adenine1518-N6/adenine1519-N6)-dimethyltransferase